MAYGWWRSKTRTSSFIFQKIVVGHKIQIKRASWKYCYPLRWYFWWLGSSFYFTWIYIRKTRTNWSAWIQIQKSNSMPNLNDGAELYEVFSDGREVLKAIFSNKENKFIPVKWLLWECTDEEILLSIYHKSIVFMNG